MKEEYYFTLLFCNATLRDCSPWSSIWLWERSRCV